jgi:hypothetical protein
MCCVPEPVVEAVVVWYVMCHVSCVVVPGVGHGGLLSWVGVLCDVAAWVGQSEHSRGMHKRHTLQVSPWWGL